MVRPSTTMSALAASGVLAASGAQAAPPPEAVRAMIERAVAGGDPATTAAVVRIARETHPDSAAEIEALAAAPAPVSSADSAQDSAPGQPPASDAVAVAAVTTQPPQPAVWSGSAELGGSQATGSSDVLGAYGAVDLTRTGPVWEHRFTSRAEYQETDGRPSTQRFGLAYEPRVKLRPGLYSFGLAQYEHDRFLGYSQRYTLGTGLGLKAIDRPDLTVAGDLGPALRRTDYYLLPQESALAGRASVNVKWLPTERITLSQEAAVYAYGQQTSAKSVTALETRLFGPLKARLSYNLQYEHDPRLARDDVDTVTRASLRYSF